MALIFVFYKGVNYICLSVGHYFDWVIMHVFYLFFILIYFLFFCVFSGLKQGCGQVGGKTDKTTETELRLMTDDPVITEGTH